MAELTPKVINELPPADTLADSDLFAISSGGSSKKTAWSVIKTAVSTLITNAINAIYPVPLNKGGTGATSAAGARTALRVVETTQLGTYYVLRDPVTAVAIGVSADYSILFFNNGSASFYYDLTPRQ